MGGSPQEIAPVLENYQSFIDSLDAIISSYNLDGIDLAIEDFNFTPQNLIDAVKFIRAHFGQDFLLIITT